MSVTMIVGEVDEPTFNGAGDAAEMVKSGGVPNEKDVVVVWVSDPLVAVIVAL